MHRWPDDPKQRGFDELRELLVAERARLHSFDVRVVVTQVLTARSSHTTSNEQVITAGMEVARTEGELISQRRKMITEKLFLSFWHIDLGNLLPEGHFRHWQVLPNDTKNYIQEA